MQERRSLPLVRESTMGRMPDPEAIKKLFSISTNHEVVEYFRDQLVAQAKSCGLSKECEGVIAEINKFVTMMQEQTSAGSAYWSGQEKDAAVSRYATFHQNLSTAAIKSLESALPGAEIHFNFAMDDQSQLVQGAFAADGTVLGEVESAKMDDVYSAWLVSRGMICREGIIFESTDGTEEDTKRPVDPDVYRRSVMDKHTGFSAYVADKTNGNVKVVVEDVSQTVYPVAGGGVQA